MVDDLHFGTTTIGLADTKSMYDERGRHNYNSQCTHFSDSQAFEGHNTYSPNKSCFKMGLTMYYVPGIEILVCCHFSCQAHVFFNLSALSCYYVGHAPTPTPQFIHPTRFSYDSSCQTKTTFLVQSTSLAIRASITGTLCPRAGPSVG